MSDDGKPSSWTMKLFRASAYLFGAIVFLQLTITLMQKLWWLFIIIGVIVFVIIGVRAWRRFRNPWM